MLAALAAVTERLRLGVLVTGNTHRHPAVLANMAASIDVISGGRLEIGLGAGWSEEEHGAYGIPLPPWPERFDRLNKACGAHCSSRHDGPISGTFLVVSPPSCAA